MKNKRLILDTNIWISFLISKEFKSLDKWFVTGKVRFLFSKELLEEFLTVIKRPKFSRYFSDKNIQELLTLFDKYGELVEISSHTDTCRDMKDNFLLDLAIDGKADYLITGDADLLVMSQIGKTKIIILTTFIDKLK